MSVSPISNTQRLKILRQLRIDDTRLDESLSDVVREVGELFATQVCFINLVLLDRQFFRSWFGSVPDEVMRVGNIHEQSLCTYVVEQSAPLVIEDLLDSTTWHEPFDWPAKVLNFYSPLGVRFYAGLPLITSGGHALGTLCLIDTKPRRIAAADLESLQFFAAKAAAELELASQSETTRRLREQLEKTSRYATALSELLFRLQNAGEARRACDIALDLIRETAALDQAALLTLDATGRAVASIGAVAADLQPDLWTATEAQYLAGVAMVPLPLTDIDAPSVLIARREPSGWTEADRFFLQSAARLIGASIHSLTRRTHLEQANLADDVTGLGNRMAFDLLAREPIEPGEPWLLFLGDLAGFTLMNNTLGHPVGDLCLRRVAEALTRSVRPEDRGRIFRYGADEFAIMVRAGLADAPAILSRFERAVSESLREYDGLRLRLDFGVVALPAEARSVFEAVALADGRMYERKRAPSKDRLSDRERQIMMMIIEGKRIKEIALELAISETTVATHRSRLLKKMNLRDNRDLFRYALRHGLIE